ncbi:MAG: type II toxin-antitoxin system RelE/ParE family toxin [Terracidiphilus sp.]|jgi:addiction module RelE/StbE family toxin
MKSRISERAIRGLTSIWEHIAKDSPEAASRVVGTIVEAARRLEQFPMSGRVGRIEGTREQVVPGLPYIILYSVAEDAILISAVIHTSRKWPKRL